MHMRELGQGRWQTHSACVLDRGDRVGTGTSRSGHAQVGRRVEGGEEQAGSGEGRRRGKSGWLGREFRLGLIGFMSMQVREVDWAS